MQRQDRGAGAAAAAAAGTGWKGRPRVPPHPLQTDRVGAGIPVTHGLPSRMGPGTRQVPWGPEVAMGAR